MAGDEVDDVIGRNALGIISGLEVGDSRVAIVVAATAAAAIVVVVDDGG